MNVVVTGAAGFIGSHLVQRLVGEGHSVRAIDCLTPYYDVSQKRENLDALTGLPGCTVHQVDIRTSDLTGLLNGVEIVFHQAGQPGVRASWDGFDEYVEHNLIGTQRLLGAATRDALRRFVFASSSSVYGDALRYPTSEDDRPAPVSPYGITKLAAEHLCRVYAENWGIPTVSLRYFTVFGPRQRPDMAMHRLIEAALTGAPFPLYGDGQQVRDFTYVDDVVEANVLAGSAALPPGRVLNIAGGTSATLLDVVRIVEELTGRHVAIDRRPPQPGDVRRTGGSIERAVQELGWRPRVSLAEGLARQVAWHEATRSNLRA